MSEFFLSSTEECPKRKKTYFSSLLLSDFHLLCSFILSHPLYFSYFLFFSPYILKILSFLSPLFITTTLLLLALLSTLCVHDASDPESPDLQPSFLFSVYRQLRGDLHSKFDIKDDNSTSFEELEAYKMVFETCPLEMGDNPVDVFENRSEETCSAWELKFVDKFCSHESTTVIEDSNKNPVLEIPLLKTDELMNLEEEEEEEEETKKCEKGETKKCEEEEEEEEETKKCEKEETKKCEEEEEEVKPLNVVEFNKRGGQIGKLPTRRESKATSGFYNKVQQTHTEKVGSQENKGNYDDDEDIGDLPRLSDFLGKISANGGEKEINADSQNIKAENTLGSFGSMRKEKEWRRTLACKLFEERHNANIIGNCNGGRGSDDGGERMDLLWETYETETKMTHMEKKEKEKEKEKKKNNKMKKSKKEMNYKEEESECDYECEEEGDGQLCCLQALKFSTGKMNLGMGRPNLVKISKAIKGIGWFHRHVTKNGKKG